MAASTLWTACLDRLQGKLSEQQLNTWLRPLHAEESEHGLRLLAPNQFVLEHVRDHLLSSIEATLAEVVPDAQTDQCRVRLGIGGAEVAASAAPAQPETPSVEAAAPRPKTQGPVSNLNPAFTFDTFVEGKSNQLARAASLQVAENPGIAYNPLFVYGGVGLGKTHLMHAIGHSILARHPMGRIIYLHSERFVADMIKALQHNAIDDFKVHYRTADALLIDDIQFFAGKDRSQEEFFHTFNSLLESRQQIILTCDRYPKEVDGIESRLRSRFGWGLTVSIEPPDFETRVAILQKKAAERGLDLEEAVASLIAKRMRSNVRDLEGALNSLIANARFSGRRIDLDYTQEILRDVLAVHDRLITIENIQKTVADFYQLRVADLLSKRRTRSIARPRQMAMFLAKSLTEHSLPEIGSAFGGRDHTTVLHACRKIDSLCETDGRLREERARLTRELSS